MWKWYADPLGLTGPDSGRLSPPGRSVVPFMRAYRYFAIAFFTMVEVITFPHFYGRGCDDGDFDHRFEIGFHTNTHKCALGMLPATLMIAVIMELNDMIRDDSESFLEKEGGPFCPGRIPARNTGGNEGGGVQKRSRARELDDEQRRCCWVTE